MMFFHINLSTSASLCRRHRFYQVNGPLHEWPWTILRIVFLGWQARNWLIALASITSSRILCGVLVHGRPEIAYVEIFLGKRYAPKVIPTFSIVYFADNLEHLRILDASKMRAGVVNDGVLPARILVDLHQVWLLCLFYVWLVKVLDRDEASELSIQR
ncbi:hypothetical protein L3X38_026002 [Prunus dulcis]|uniref:Uncharacterized protein n=1 Tax=Prunus dulcis TaxID=3755 RepID=A0AAD4W2X8_PRUDU|nr:hypothetical protein L3X38_026002 [Prunus dulcis]